MPTVIAIDCSLSMSRVVSAQGKGDNTAKVSHKKLAVQACTELLNYFESRLKLEYVALIAFASTTRVLSHFTRDHAALKSALSMVKIRDKACLEGLFEEIDFLLSKEFGSMVACNVIVITDGRLNWRADFRTILSEDLLRPWKFPKKFQCTIDFLCVSNDMTKSGREGFIQALIMKNEGRGSINVIKNPESNYQGAVTTLVNNFTSSHMKVFTGTLHCGKLKNEIVLFPSPDKQLYPGDSSSKDYRSVSSDMQIVGFLNISDVKNPPSVSRHLILPQGNGLVSAEETQDTGSDLGSVPCFIVTLHGSLKIEHKVALVVVGDNWYGMISALPDQKKKSNLVLSLFEIGSEYIPWLGSLDQLGPVDGAPQPPVDKKNVTMFTPLGDSKSYAQNLVVWTRPTGLQTDVQKLLRSAKRLPEKTQVFYKELNRIRKAALAFGFFELLEGIASILERECTMLPGTSHPEAALQLSHAAQELRTVRGYDNAIVPLKTDFKYHARS